MPTVLITGGTGLIGKALTSKLVEKNYHVIILTRQIPANKKRIEVRNGKGDPAVEYAVWDVEKQQIDAVAINRADFIVHLAGAGVADKRWTAKRKKQIIDSRVRSSQLLVKGLEPGGANVKAVVSASAIGWYGPDQPGAAPFTENAPSSDDFLGRACAEWEKSIEPVAKSGVRLVKLRIGIVLSPKGGALKEFLKPLRVGMAAILGSGGQIISWISIDDLVSLFIFSMEQEQMRGVYNAVAPHPVTNRELMIALAKSRKKFFIPFKVPSFLLKLVLGELSTEVLKSTTVSSAKIQQAGFEYSSATIEKAFGQLIT